MFIQKFIHLHHSVAETKAHFARLHTYRLYLEGVGKALLTADGVAQFDCLIFPRHHLHVVAVELPTEDPNQILFQSTVGNLKMSGLVEFAEVRPNVTEVRLSLEYRPKSWVLWVEELFLHKIERYLERQLRTLQGCLDGPLSHSPQAVSAARQMSRAV